jgi:AraC-like DNA-binding protein
VGRRFLAPRLATLPIPAALDGQVELHHERWTDPRPHRHRELELNLVVAGHARCVVGERCYELAPGTLAWLFAAQNHILLVESRDFAMWVAVFRPRLVDGACVGEARPLRELDPDGWFCRRLAPAGSDALARLMGELRDARGDAPRHNAGLAWLLLDAWRRYQQAATPDVAELHPAVARAARRLSSDPAAPLRALARAAGLSPGRLGRVFKRELGASVAAYRNRARIDAVLARLRERPRDGMLAAALHAGFGSYTQFHRVFTATMGRSPREWKKRTASSF